MDRRNGEHWAGRLYMRRISLYLTRVFLALGWSPNQITWLMIACGIGAAPALLIPGVAGPIVAVVLIQLYLLLDCCDGEVARWTKRTSPTGVYLDRVG
ncbi:MAG: CDP-alcohol phosphatidyltransferase family protein, partial [Actinobacteria bacterium]|nr:CDP-alcohol phosphatidyltransferase family protein [Actinomycetota bacterium]